MCLPAFAGMLSDSGSSGSNLADLGPAEVHAFPGVVNAASNALCRRARFLLAEEDAEIVFSGRPLRCNHWALPQARLHPDRAHTGLRPRAA